MDEMIIKTPWTTAIVSWIIKQVIRKKLGYDVDVQLNNFKTTVMDNKMQMHLDVDFGVNKEDVNELLKSVRQ